MAGRADETLLRTDVPAAARHGRAGDEALLRADVPGIHVLCCWSKDVDARHKAGHDEWTSWCVICHRLRQTEADSAGGGWAGGGCEGVSSAASRGGRKGTALRCGTMDCFAMLAMTGKRGSRGC